MVTPTTLMFWQSPRTARLRFRLRPLSNWLFCMIIFAVAAILLALIVPVPFVWLADALAIAILFYINFFVLDKRAINIRCPHCGDYLLGNAPWNCGNCKA